MEHERAARARDAHAPSPARGGGSGGGGAATQRLSLFNDGSPEGVAHEIRMLAERLRDVEDELAAEKQKHSSYTQVWMSAEAWAGAL